MAQVKDLDGIVAQLKGSVAATERILAGWARRPMFDRREGRTYSVDEFCDAFRAHLAARHAEVAEGAAEITRLLAATAKKLLIPKGGSPSWSAYVESVSKVVAVRPQAAPSPLRPLTVPRAQNGLVAAVMSSLKTLAAQVDPDTLTRHETPPLLEIALELAAPDIVWQPEIGASTLGTAGVRDVFDSWVDGFLRIGSLVARVDGAGGDYAAVLTSSSAICDAVAALRKLVLANEEACAAFRAKYLGFDYLWLCDLDETLQNFLAANASAGGGDPPLECFDAEIARYKAAQAEVAALPAGVAIGWLRVDARPIKQALSTWVTKRVFLFTNYLFEKVVTSMQELYEFIGASTRLLDQDPAAEAEPAGRQAALYEVMACMRDVRKRADRTDASFEPLRAAVALLKGYGIAMEEATLAQLDQGPMAWGALRKRMLNLREKLTDLQQEEARVIRERSEAFATRVDAFRAAFQKLAPFAVPGPAIRLEDVAPAYEALDAFRHGSSSSRFSCGSIGSVAAEGRALNEAQELFEIFVSDYVALRRCEEELNLLKALWDMASNIMHTLAEWNKTPWDKIDTEFLMDEAKALIKCAPAPTRPHSPLLSARATGRSKGCPRLCAASRHTCSWRSRSRRC